MKIKKFEKIFTYMLMLVCAVFVVYIFCFSALNKSVPSEQLMPEFAQKMSTGWERERIGSGLGFSRTLPAIGKTDKYIAFRSFNSGVNVKINGQSIYSYGLDEKPALGQYSGSVLCMVPVRPDYSGQRIEIELRDVPSVGDVYSLGDVYLGSWNMIIVSILWGSIDAVIFDFVMLLAAAGCLALFFYHMLTNRGQREWMYFHMASFIFLSALWTTTDTLIIQMATSHTLLYGYVLSFLSLMLLPQPLLSIARELCPCGEIYFRRLQIVLWAYTAGAMGLYMTNSVNLFQVLPLLHVLLFAGGGGILFYSVKEYKTTRSLYAKYYLMSVGLLFVVMIVQVALFYQGERSDITGIFRHGLGVLAFCFMVIGLQRVRSTIEQKSKMEMYKKMAYLDTMTGMKNRNAYSKQIENLLKKQGEYHSMQALMFDVNNLKQTNDTHGHDAGDRLIRAAAQVLHEVFPKEKMCYRIGGDEFLVLLKNRVVEEKALQEELFRKCKEVEEKHRIEISISMGCASMKTEDGDDMDVLWLIQKADEKMYKNKIIYKASV